MDIVIILLPGFIIPDGFMLRYWWFFTSLIALGGPTVWELTGNILIFVCSMVLVVLVIFLMAVYVLLWLTMLGWGLFLGGLIVLHAFPTLTLIVVIFLIF